MAASDDKGDIRFPGLCALRSKAAGQNHKQTPADAEARFSAAVDQMKAS